MSERSDGEIQRISLIATGVVAVTAIAAVYAPRTAAKEYVGGFPFNGTLEAWLNILYILIAAQVAAFGWLSRRCRNTKKLDVWLRAESRADEYAHALIEKVHTVLTSGGSVAAFTDSIVRLHASIKVLTNLESRRSTMFLCWASATLGMTVTVVFRLLRLSEAYVGWSLIAALGLFIVECGAGLPLFLRILHGAPEEMPDKLDDVHFAPSSRNSMPPRVDRTERRDAWWPDIFLVLKDGRSIAARPRNYSPNGRGCGLVCREKVDTGATVRLSLNGSTVPALVRYCDVYGGLYRVGLEVPESSRQPLAHAFAKHN